MLKRSVNIFVLANILAILGLVISGYFEGAVGTVVYISSFLLPTLLALFLAYKYEGARPVRFTLCVRDFVNFAPLVFPTVALIIGISMLTTLLLSLFGESPSDVMLYDTFIENVLFHALIPAVIEEALFRYLPMVTVGSHSRRVSILLSSLLFALIHCNLFQIPYAFAAGIIFSVLDFMFDSILPSLILHFTNNLISVTSLYYGAELAVLIPTLAIAVISIGVIAVRRNRYIEILKTKIPNESKQELTYSPLLVIIPTLLVAILNLLG